MLYLYYYYYCCTVIAVVVPGGRVFSVLVSEQHHHATYFVFKTNTNISTPTPGIYLDSGLDFYAKPVGSVPVPLPLPLLP